MTAREVRNTCPNCGKSEIFRLSLPYADEGHMICTPCKHRAEREEQEADAEREFRAKILGIIDDYMMGARE